MLSQETERLFTAEPRLAALLTEAKAIRDNGTTGSFCANFKFFKQGGLKDRLQVLVGYSAANPRLRTSRAYDLAYSAIYAVLPPCRNCACLPAR
jgi:hypothetical protein